MLWYCSFHRTISCLHEDLECYKLALWHYGQLWDRRLWTFEAFWLVQAKNKMRRSAIALRLPKRIQAHNRPVALRGHVTNASFKRCVEILLMPKIDRTHKNYLTPEIWEETHLRQIFMALWFFNKAVWFVSPFNMAAKFIGDLWEMSVKLLKKFTSIINHFAVHFKVSNTEILSW